MSSRCAAAASPNGSPPPRLGPLIATDQTVKDIDLLRVLLGRDKINWVGYSAGTWMGAHYAQTFPAGSSSTEFTTTWQKSFDAQPLGFERRWRQDFLPWMAKYDKLYHFGTTGEAARQTYEQIRYALTQGPVTLPDGSHVSANGLDSFIAAQIYSKRAFPGLASVSATTRPPDEAGTAAGRIPGRMAACRPGNPGSGDGREHRTPSAMGGTGRSSGKKVRPGGEVRGLLRQRRQVPVPAQSRQRRNRRLRRSLRDQSRGQAVQRAASDAKNVETDG